MWLHQRPPSPGCTGAAVESGRLFFSASLCLSLSAWEWGSPAVSSWGSLCAKSSSGTQERNSAYRYLRILFIPG
uniref:Uncharacterized protein n=1 Tax=Marmota marmota marmota TaxID=9994 RepID=A0A8C5ZQR1_MARMA